MTARKQLIQMKSEYLNRDGLVGVVVPEKMNKIMLLLHGFNGTFRHLEDNLPLEEYANEGGLHDYKSFDVGLRHAFQML